MMQRKDSHSALRWRNTSHRPDSRSSFLRERRKSLRGELQKISIACYLLSRLYRDLAVCFSGQVSRVLFVLCANVFEHIGVGQKSLDEIDRDRLREHLRVGHRDRDLKMPEIAAVKAFLNAHILAVTVAAGIQPGFIVESRRVYNERVAVIFADRITQPCSCWIAGKRAAVGEDLPEDGLHFVQDQNFARRLNDLERLGQKVRMRHSIRKTLQVGTDDSRLRVPAQKFLAERCQGLFAPFEIRKDIPEVF